MKFNAKEFLESLPLPANGKWINGVWDVEAFKKKGVSLVLFAPRGADLQTSHDEDEFYFVISGSGELTIDNERFSCAVGDAFFVPAGIPHRFEQFTEDFVTWAVFF